MYYFFYILQFYLSINSLPDISLEALHSKSSFRYTSLALSFEPIVQRVSILDESSKNARTFSALSEPSVCLIRSTDSLNQ